MLSKAAVSRQKNVDSSTGTGVGKHQRMGCKLRVPFLWDIRFTAGASSTGASCVTIALWWSEPPALPLEPATLPLRAACASTAKSSSPAVPLLLELGLRRWPQRQNSSSSGEFVGSFREKDVSSEFNFHETSRDASSTCWRHCRGRQTRTKRNPMHLVCKLGVVYVNALVLHEHWVDLTPHDEELFQAQRVIDQHVSSSHPCIWYPREQICIPDADACRMQSQTIGRPPNGACLARHEGENVMHRSSAHRACLLLHSSSAASSATPTMQGHDLRNGLCLRAHEAACMGNRQITGSTHHRPRSPDGGTEPAKFSFC